MAAVYKALSKKDDDQKEAKTDGANSVRKNKQKVLLLSSRGATFRHRHLLNDLASIMPHARKEAKFDNKSQIYQLNELAELYSCNNSLYFETRKNQDLYAYMSKVPNGPTAKFHVQNLSTMDELHFTGNCLKGSRPVLSFDSAFDSAPHFRLIRELMFHIFGVPQGARKSKPFVDHVMSFSIADGKIWARNYQISEVEADKKQGDDNEDVETTGESRKRKRPSGGHKDTEIKLVEIGPRFVLTPIIIQEGSFGGPIIYENKEYISPNQVRSDLRKRSAVKHTARAEKYVERLAKKNELGISSNGTKRRREDDLDVKTLFS